MRLNRTLKVGFALLLVVMLPLRSYAVMAGCALGSAALHGVPSAHAIDSSHCIDSSHGAAHNPHCVHGAGTAHARGCSECCCMAGAAPIPARWLVPRMAAVLISPARMSRPPAVVQDRLDRPPRPPVA